MTEFEFRAMLLMLAAILAGYLLGYYVGAIDMQRYYHALDDIRRGASPEARNDTAPETPLARHGQPRED